MPFFGFLLDQVIGDPPGWPHPVILMGKAVSFLDKHLNRGTPQHQRLGGVVLTLMLVGGSYALTWGLVLLADMVHPYLGVVLQIVLISTTLAGRSLLEAGKAVLRPLRATDLPQARRTLAGYVSRDTSRLSEGEVVRGTVETLAENFVDGIFSPLLYASLGGAPLAMAFKAVSTLDSMVGYRNQRYRDFGWFSARADDWANFLPARLAIIILVLAGFFQRLPVRRALKIWRRDACLHPSPNGGHPESVVAGLLGVKLGGVNIYHGKPSHRAEMGDALHELTVSDIRRTLSLVHLGTWLGLVPAILIAVLVH
ncbi:MAG: adenosylcobinamide-phosphate synthase CbiB [Desulfitobacteriaceae bacterium]